LKAGFKISQSFVTKKNIVSMAASVFKWLLLPLAGILLASGKKPMLHPLHVSVLEIEHNAADKTLEISCRIFTDDFEKILAKNYKAKTDLINPPNKAAMDTLIKKYILSHLSIKADGRLVGFHYLGFENETEAVYSYIEVEKITTVKKIEISTNIMHDMFDDQVNIIHTTVGGKRVSSKLDYPNKEAVFSF
jgi:hypothetical protein